MNMKIAILLTACIVSAFSQDINKIFEDVNNNYTIFNSIAAELTWESSVDPSNLLSDDRTVNYQKKIITWQQNVCEELVALENLQLLNDTQRRQTYILCRGPKFTYRESRVLSTLHSQLQSIYSDVEICVPSETTGTKGNLTITEAAILDYLSKMKKLFKLSDATSFSAKIAATNEVDQTGVVCLNGENDFEKMMEYSKEEGVLKWVWLAWREKIAAMKEPFDEMVEIENRAARRNGYEDIGSSWREELEIPDLPSFCRRLYASVKPLYTMLHGIVRFYLRRLHQDIPERGPIPAHLLGNLWSQNWGSLINLFTAKSIDLDKRIKSLNWTVLHMVKRADDFYQSMGLPAMTAAFWQESVFENKNSGTLCHGTAADMFKDGDYRLLYCAGTTMEDFYVLHHELGHIQYYMAYADQPGLFRQANSALHESIGDAVMYGVMAPQHLHRLGLVNDSTLYVNTSTTPNNTAESRFKLHAAYDSMNKENKNDLRRETSDRIYKQSTETNNDDVIDELLKSQEAGSFNWRWNKFEKEGVTLKEGNVNNINKLRSVSDKEDFNNVGDKKKEDITTDEIMLLKQALTKIPEIPFALLIDEYRWKYFDGSLNPDKMNKEFWDLALELQGIAPPEERGEDYFDIGAKFHVSDNTAYVRYFLSSFLQHQIFEALCRAAVFGNRDLNAHIPDTISLNRCDIYGSKAAGRLLRDLMSRGNSQHWREILQSTTGNTDITAKALKRYYRPLYNVLAQIIKKNKIPLGW